MAKGKQATALFEVIHASKRPPKASPGAEFPTPRWWHKGKRQETALDDAPADPRPVVATPAHEASGGTQRSWLAAARQVAAERSAQAVEAQTVHAPTLEVRTAPLDTETVPPVPFHSPAPEDGLPTSMADDEETESDERLLNIPRGTIAAAQPLVPETPAYEPVSVEPTPVAAPYRSTASSLPLPTFGTEPDDDGPAWGDDPTAGRDPTQLLRPAARQTTPEPAVVAPAARPTVTALRSKLFAAKPPTGDPAEPRLVLNRAGREIRFKLSYLGAAAAGSAVAAALALAFVAGLKSGGDPSAATQARGRTPVVASPPDLMAVQPVTPIRTTTPTARPGDPAPTPPAVFKNADRQVGARYVVVTFSLDQSAAETIATYLTHNGLPCTVTQASKNVMRSDFFTVVGTQPFVVNGDAAAFTITPQMPADLVAYAQKAGKLYEQFNNGSRLPAKMPAVFVWTKDDAAAAAKR